VVALALSASASPAFSTEGSNDHRRGHHDEDPREVADRLSGPRGVVALDDDRTLVTEDDGTFSLVVQRHHRSARVIELGRVRTRFAPAIDVSDRGRVYRLTTGEDVGGERNAATLFEWRPGWDDPREVADIGRYQALDEDPYDLERKPRESNPYGLAALDDGSVLVADDAGNDLLRVERDGDIETVARLKPRRVQVPHGLGTRDPEGNRLPRAGSWVKSEAVPTSVVVGDDGFWYVGELRGWPATPETSQVWRIEPDTEDEVCDPREPDEGDCRRYADGLTSIVDLAAGEDDTLYALSLSKKSWLRFEMRDRGASVGGLFAIEREGDRWRHDDDWSDWDGDRRHRGGDGWDDWNGEGRHHGEEDCDEDWWDDWQDGRDDWGDDRDDWSDDRRHEGCDDDVDVTIRELVEDELILPGGVDVDDDRGDIFVVAPMFGRGALLEIDD
jgi:hypothetical protein